MGRSSLGDVNQKPLRLWKITGIIHIRLRIPPAQHVRKLRVRLISTAPLQKQSELRVSYMSIYRDHMNLDGPMTTGARRLVLLVSKKADGSNYPLLPFVWGMPNKTSFECRSAISSILNQVEASTLPLAVPGQNSVDAL